MSHDLAHDRRPLRTIYVAEPLDLPPLSAGAAFDAYREAAPDPGREMPVPGTPTAELHLSDTCVPGYGPPWQIRRAYGRIRRPGGFRSAGFGVEVEVLAWSDVRCEVGIRPRGRASLLTDGLRQGRYLALALAAAESLAATLQAMVHDGLRLQLSGIDSRHPSLSLDGPPLMP